MEYKAISKKTMHSKDFKAWLSHAHCNYGGQDQRDTLPYNAWILPSEEFRTRDRNLCNAGSGLLR